MILTFNKTPSHRCCEAQLLHTFGHVFACEDIEGMVFSCVMSLRDHNESLELSLLRKVTQWKTLIRQLAGSPLSC